MRKKILKIIKINNIGMPVWSESSAPNSALDDKISFVVQNNTDYVFLGVWDNPSNGWFSDFGNERGWE